MENKTVLSHEAFLRLMQIARENEEIRKKLINILVLDEFNKSSALNTFIEEMRQQNAPVEFITAIACLLDPKVAEKALELLGARP